MFEVGTGKAIITALKKGIGMMGYGRFQNTIHGKETELYARTYIFRDPATGNKVAFVNAEIAFITIAIKRGVLKKLSRKHPELGFTESNVLLNAQHTHSGPGGYSHYGFYNLSIPGFVPFVFQTIVDGIVSSIVEGCSNFQPAKLTMTSGEFEPDKEVAFNRSVAAYNRNPEVEPIDKKDAHLAVDRKMELMRLETLDGKPIGMINWFGIHPTSLPNYNTDINADNKGYASTYTEEEFRKRNQQDFMAVFAQGTAGDVSPNWIWDWKTFRTRGKFLNNLESAKFNGNLQFEKATEIWDTPGGKEVEYSKGIESELMYFDFSDIECDPEFTNGKTGMLTTPSCIGVEMIEGTKEGPGMVKPVGYIAKGLTIFMKWYEHLITWAFRSEEELVALKRKYRFQGKKHILIETGNRKILATRNVKRLIIPGFVDGGIKTFKKHHRIGSLNENPWSAQVLPLQIIRLGNIALVAIPGEITTIAGKRLRETLLKYLSPAGINHIILAPYSNAYSGYLTTYEEYQSQQYEGGHTVFGEYTLAAFQTKYKLMAQEFCKHESERAEKRSSKPVQFPEEDLRLRTFQDGMEFQPRRAKKKQKIWKANTTRPVPSTK